MGSDTFRFGRDVPAYHHKPGGVITMDGVEVAQTIQCCHCNKHWVHKTGCGLQRGFCIRCMQATCGGSHCRECVPFEKKLEAIEKRSA